jgi:hypothetical protein
MLEETSRLALPDAHFSALSFRESPFFLQIHKLLVAFDYEVATAAVIDTAVERDIVCNYNCYNAIRDIPSFVETKKVF